MAPEPSRTPKLDLAAAQSWLEQLHGDSQGLIHVCSNGHWTGTVCQSIGQALQYIRTQDTRSTGVYVRVTTLNRKLPRGSRGGEVDSSCLPALWADVDFAGPGHRSDGLPLPLPPDEASAHKIISESGLPDPTCWVHSGGGLYPFWMLKTPYCINDEDDLPRARALSRGWHEVIRATAEQQGWHYGTETADLARVLRIPGTINRKVDKDPHLVRLLPNEGTGRLYEFDELLHAMDQRHRVLVPPTPPPSSLPVPVRSDDDVRPGDDFNAREPWDSEHLLHNWTVHRVQGDTTFWTRPGKNPRLGCSATTGHAVDADRLYVFSSLTQLPVETPLTKFAVYTLLHHGGDYSAAARRLRELGYGSQKQVPAPPDELRPAPADGQATEGRVIEPAQNAGDSDKYFGKRGLQVRTLAADVMDMGPLALGVNDVLWAYTGGVWSPVPHVVRKRVSQLLGEAFRTSHVSNAEAAIRDLVPWIDAGPVEQFINFCNGSLDWRTGTLHPHTPEVMSTVQLNTEYDPSARCPRFHQFLAEVLPADAIETAWELMGYLMYSGNPLHKAVMLKGDGRNGKSTFIKVMNALLGSQNVSHTSLHRLADNRFATSTLLGKIANLVGDIESSYVIDTAIFKAVVGEDQLSADMKYREPFHFTPWAVPVFSANAIPACSDASSGYLDRWLVIPFPNKFKEEDKDIYLERELTSPSELAGIAVEALKRLPRLLERGAFRTSDSLEDARGEFIRTVDNVRMWLEECTEPAPEESVKRSELYGYYKAWCARDGYRAVSARKFYERLNAAGCIPDKPHGGIRVYLHLRVTDNGAGVDTFRNGPYHEGA